MDWVDKPQNYKDLYGTFQTFRGSHLNNFSWKTLLKTWLGSFSFSNISVEMFRFSIYVNTRNASQSSHVYANGYYSIHIYDIKVAKHSFRARSCQCNSMCALGLQKNSVHIVVICSMSPLHVSVLFFFITEHNVLTVLVSYNKGNNAKNPAILSFFVSKRTQQLNAVY